MGDKLLRVGVVGGSHTSAVGRAHMSALRMDGLFSVDGAVFSRSFEASIQSMRAYSIPTCSIFSRARELYEWAAAEADMLLILTPSNDHLSQVLDALEARVPIVVEKPLGRSSAEVRAIQKRAADYGVSVITIYNYTGYPMVRESRSLVLDGLIGALHKARVHMPQETYLRIDSAGSPVTPQSWRLNDETVPMVGLDLGIHTLNLINYLTGQRPVSSQTTIASFGHFPEVADDIECILGFDGPLQASMWVSKSAIGYRNGLNFSLLGRRGSLHWKQSNPERLILNLNTGERQILERGSPLITGAVAPELSRFKAGHPGGFVEALANYYRDVYSYLRDGTIPPGLGLVDVALRDQLDLELVVSAAKSHTTESLADG